MERLILIEQLILIEHVLCLEPRWGFLEVEAERVLVVLLVKQLSLNHEADLAPLLIMAQLKVDLLHQVFHNIKQGLVRLVALGRAGAPSRSIGEDHGPLLPSRYQKPRAEVAGRAPHKDHPVMPAGRLKDHPPIIEIGRLLVEGHRRRRSLVDRHLDVEPRAIYFIIASYI